MQISKIILYDEPTVPEIKLESLKKFLKETFPITIETRKNFFDSGDEKMYEKIAQTRIFDLKKPFTPHMPAKNDMLIEIQNKDMSNLEEMTLYDGYELQKNVLGQIPINEMNFETLHIILTNKLTCTFDENDFRYHARALIGSNPAIISTTGIIEAPAKPKKYYLELMTNFSNDKIDEIKKKYAGEFLEYHDSRLSEIVEGYLLQAIFYHETGEAFCNQNHCRLFNAHWQKDLLYSQIENKQFCAKHQNILKKFQN
ncbi:MAG: hypothetical protein K5790_01430 [Nitrosopumilus sp.]|uniref:DUF6775 family putative metallopeptidase n=1 Tax=Nitrosopumilus sp. TaxID=2024843 RepID=UPI00247EE610|nr:DUF6775 family putative metallopeptidase [Nitrosopumilus sp.]MCV0391935.1 hypothetical protein [Nitrosopumilus sp.]